jgi:hypothetical protein
VQSTSTMQVAALKLLAGTPFEIQVRVVSQPTLQVTSTGDAATSSVQYTAPVLAVEQGGKSLGQLDAANPKLDIPIGIPLAAGAPSLPIIGGLLANGQQATAALNRLDLGVIRLGVAQLDQRGAAMTSPFKGYQLGATARMLDLQVLPTQALGLPNLPTALAQVSLGEQVARAYAPAGGVVCRTSEQPAPAPTPKPQGSIPLAYTTMAYKTIPLFWTGTAMLLIGVVLVAALPRMRTLAPVGPRVGGAGEPDDTGSADAVGASEDPAEGAEEPTDVAEVDLEETEQDAGAPEAEAEPETPEQNPLEAEAHATETDPTEAEPETRATEGEAEAPAAEGKQDAPEARAVDAEPEDGPAEASSPKAAAGTAEPTNTDEGPERS